MNIQDEIKTMKRVQPVHFKQTILANIDRMKLASLDANASSDASIVGLYFITTTFKDLPDDPTDTRGLRYKSNIRHPETEKNISVVRSSQAKFCKHVLNQTVSNAHYKSRKKLYPVAMCFIDFPGSRDFQPRIYEMPHFHSIFIVPPKTKPKFDQLIADNFRLERAFFKTRNIQTLDCQDLRSTGRDLTTNIQYNSKFLRHDIAKTLSEDAQSDLYLMFGAT